MAYYQTDKIGKIDRDKKLEIYETYQNLPQVEEGFDVDAFLFEDEGNKRFIWKNKEKAYLKTKKEITLRRLPVLTAIYGVQKRAADRIDRRSCQSL